MTSSRDDLTAALAAAVRDLTSLLPPERWHLLYPATAETIALVQDDDAMAALLAEDPPDRPPTAGEGAGVSEAALLRRLAAASAVEDCHHEGCMSWLTVGDQGGVDITPDEVEWVLRHGATDDRRFNVPPYVPEPAPGEPEDGER